MILLVTPAHIGLLNEATHKSILAPIVRRCFAGNHVGREVDVLAAVVDLIPLPKFNDHALVHETFGKSWTLKDLKHGSEGIAAIATSTEGAAPDLWAPRSVGPDQIDSQVESPTTLSFSIRPILKRVSTLQESEKLSLYTKRVLQLPVTNTSFVNGEPSTLYAQRWKIAAMTGSKIEITPLKRTMLPEQTLNVWVRQLGTTTTLPSEVILPVKPLTPWRTVTAAVGNIVREVQLDKNSSSTEPASKDLEQRLASISSKEGGSRIDVWALVHPLETWVTHPTIPRPSRNPFYGDLIDQGCRLHKVVSGGSAWGSGGGLLSLDPATTFNRRETSPNSFESFAADNGDLDLAQKKAFGETVKPGDRIQFFALPVLNSGGQNSFDFSGTRSVASPRYMAFGTTGPPREDLDASEGPVAEGKANAEGTITVKNHFGMLSERGMSVRVDVVFEGDSSSLGAEPVGCVTETRLDAPHVQFRLEETTTNAEQNIVQEKPKPQRTKNTTRPPKTSQDNTKSRPHQGTEDTARPLSQATFNTLAKTSRPLESESARHQSPEPALSYPHSEPSAHTDAKPDEGQIYIRETLKSIGARSPEEEKEWQKMQKENHAAGFVIRKDRVSKETRWRIMRNGAKLSRERLTDRPTIIRLFPRGVAERKE